MPLFLLNVLLAVVWVLMLGAADLYTFAAGFGIGYVLLGLFARPDVRGGAHGGYATKGRELLSFTGYFIYILVKANWQVAREVLRSDPQRQARIIRYDVAGLNDVQTTTLANAITLTPGTLVIDISPDGHWLYVHCLFAPDRAGVTAELDDLRDRMMREVF